VSPAYNSSLKGRSASRRPTTISRSVPRAPRGVLGQIARQRGRVIGHPLSLPTSVSRWLCPSPEPGDNWTPHGAIPYLVDWDGMRAPIYF